MTDKLKDKLEGEDKEKIEAAVKDALEWLDENQVRTSCFGLLLW